ncbi:hypothetical protein M3Y95_01264700 [Aphelenchoides besseyi]|nr:hypothetical protein M3Y95_01264700 [Aphelenchoides besseyi]
MPDSIFKNHWNKVKAQLKVLKKKEVYAYDYKRHLIQEWIEDQKANNPDFDVDIYKSQQNSPYNTAAVIRTMTNYLNGEKFSNVDLVGQLLLLQNIDHKKPLSTQPQEFKDFAYNLWRYMTLSQQKSLRQIKIHLISLFLKLHDDYEFPGKFVFEAQKQHIISWLEGKTKEEVDGYELPTAKNKKVRNALMELRDELQELNVNWGRSFTYERPPEFKAHVKSLMVDGDAKQHSVFGFLSKEIEDFLGAFDIDVVMQWTEETPEFRLFIQNARKIASANRVSDANLSKASNPLSRLKRIRATMFKKETGKHYVFDQNPGRYRHVEWNEESDAIFCRYIDEGMQMIKVNSQRLLEDIRKAMDNQELSPRQIFERLAQLQSIDELWKSKEMIRRLNVYVSEAPAESFSHQSSPTTDLFHRLCEKVWQSADEKDIRRPTADRIHAQTVMFMNAKNQRDPNYKTVDTKLYAFVSQNMNLTDDEWAETELSDLTNEVNDVLRLENPNYRLVQVAEVRGRSNYMRAALQVLNDNRHFQGTGIPIPVRNLLVYSTEEYTSLTLTRINDPNQS